MDEQALLNLFRRCEHKYETVAPDSWAADPRYMTVTCARLVGDAKVNGCSVEGCPHTPKEKKG